MKHETRHHAVHGLRDNTYHETTNEIPYITSMTWFPKHADKSFKLKCASEMLKFVVEFQFQPFSTVIVMFHVAKKERLQKDSFLTGSIY